MLTSTFDMAPKRPSKTSARGRQDHPTGPLVTVDDSFVEDVRKAMVAQGWDQQMLAEKISVSMGAISRFFQPGQKQIRFKPRLQELFGWVVDERGDRARREIIDQVPLLGDEDAQTVAALIKSLAAKRRSTAP